MRNAIPEIKNPLKHSGTNRFQRLADEMAFDYVQIEERHEADFIVYAEKLTQHIQFYDQNNQPAGNWQSFFDRNVPSNQPHKALFIAFLRLLEALNEHLNGLTKRHLDYYYREVLKFTDREAKPAQAYLFMECAKSLKTRFVEKSATLLAGKNEDGQEILFETVDEIVVNKAELMHYFTVLNQGEAFDNRLFAKDYSEFLNGNDTGKNFPAFGESQTESTKKDGGYVDVISSKLTMDPARVGFAISSPLLRLEEGEREIHITLVVDKTSGVNPNREQFIFEISSEDDWFNIPSERIDEFKLTTDGLKIVIKLKNTDPAVVVYDQEMHQHDFRCNQPVLQMRLDPTAEEFAYKSWKHVEIEEVKLKVSAKGVRTLIVQNELSTLDPSKPFLPFGPIPSVNDHFYIGHSDIFKHELDTLDAKIKWKDLAYDQFSEHYANYSVGIVNNDFKAEAAFLRDKDWEPSGTYNLFNSTDESNANQQLIPASAKSERTIGIQIPSEVERLNRQEVITEWNYQTDHGFLRLTLKGIDKENFQAFGHKNYPKEIQRITRENAGQTNPTNIKELNQPYTPVIEQLTLDFTTAEVEFSTNNDDQFYHVTHYGQKITTYTDTTNPTTLFPAYANEGEAYIGISNLDLPQALSILVQMDEGSGNADLSQIDSGIHWFYLSGNEWKPMDRLRISLDTTQRLQGSGIIRFDLPVDMDTDHQIMPTDLYWLKAVAPERTGGLDRLQSLHAQAVLVREVNPELSNEVVSPESISKLSTGNSGLAKIKQPYASFGGTKPDTPEIFYARITERLRHKDRGIMIWDYERLLLDEFPNLYKVKCLNHTNYQTEMVAGHVMLAVIPNLRKKGLHSPFQPKLSIHKRMKMYDFLRERISPFIYLRVENPIYEPIQLSFNVGFHEGYDEGFYGKKLHQQLQEFLSPWAFENELNEKSDLVFGGELHKSTILKFMEELEYVDFVNDFNMYHIYRDPAIAEKFTEPELIDDETFYSVSNPDGPCEQIKMQLYVDDTNQPTIQLKLKVRFLNGLIETAADPVTGIQEPLPVKFRRQLYRALKRRIDKGETITKTLVRILIKNIFYVDKLIELDFYKTLPDDYVMEDVDVAVAKTSRSIMVTAEQHRIGVYRAGDYNCEGNVVIGIGFMIVEADFIIPETNEQAYYEYQAR
jgi:hypothetical protein